MLYIVAIGWMFVVILMSVVEATSPNGSVLGAFFTFLLYGVIPLGLVLYLLGTPLRAKQRQTQDEQNR
jgi:mannose/fructose/N-acetylgalactosamine-specific phosphotransferase system component IID